MRRSLFLVVGAVAMTSVACVHYSADIPGVLDLRSDGKDTPPPHDALVVDKVAARAGFDALLDGVGVQADGNRVSVEDRHTWLGITAVAPGTLLVFNGDVRPELEAALGKKGALRNLYIGHEQSLMDALTWAARAVPFVVCPVGTACAPVGPTMTFRASGERISTTPGGVASPLPLGEAAPSGETGSAADVTTEEGATGSDPGSDQSSDPAEAAPPNVGADAAPAASLPPAPDAKASPAADAPAEDDK